MNSNIVCTLLFHKILVYAIQNLTSTMLRAAYYCDMRLLYSSLMSLFTLFPFLLL